MNISQTMQYRKPITNATRPVRGVRAVTPFNHTKSKRHAAQTRALSARMYDESPVCDARDVFQLHLGAYFR